MIRMIPTGKVGQNVLRQRWSMTLSHAG